MPKTITVTVTVRVEMKLDDGVDLQDAVQEIEYDFKSGDGFKVLDTEIINAEEAE